MISLVLAIALAASEAERAADAHFKRGAELAAKGDYRASLVEFEEAYRIAPAWQVLFNLGVVRGKLGEPVAALEAFEAYLEQGGAKVPPARAKQVEDEIASLRREVGELVIQVDGPPAELEVDGRASSGRRVYVLPGRHVAAARRDGQEARTEVEVHKGDRVVVALVPPPVPEEPKVVVLTPVPVATPPPPVVVPTRIEEPPPPWYRRWYVWTVVGVVVAGSATAVAIAATRPKWDVRVDAP